MRCLRARSALWNAGLRLLVLLALGGGVVLVSSQLGAGEVGVFAAIEANDLDQAKGRSKTDLHPPLKRLDR